MINEPLLASDNADAAVVEVPESAGAYRAPALSPEQRLLQLQADHIAAVTQEHRSSRPSVTIEFQQLSYVVQGNNRILHDLNGVFRAGELTALMGPSGAGKSTLLNVLAGFRTKQSSGRVLVNGEDRILPLFRKFSCFVMQDDVLLKNLTVQEYMLMSAELRLPESLSENDKLKLVKEVIKSMGLDKHSGVKAMSLSGGQRKRLAVALELLNDPPLLFLDEPTSGLDSTTAFSVVRMMRQLAQSGRTIICTIHQPSATLFELFDQVYLLARGQCLYNGSVTGIVPYFRDQGIECPQYHNPADFIMEVASGDKGSLPPLLAAWREAEKARPAYVPPAPLPSQRSFSLGSGQYVTSHLTQFQVLLKRSFREVTRDLVLTRMRFGSHIGMGILIGLLFLHIGYGPTHVQDTLGYYFFAILFLMLASAMPTVLTFPIEKEVFTREHLNNWYSVRAYYAAKSIADFPFQIIFPVIFGTITYWMLDQPSSGSVFFKVLFVYICHTQVAQALAVVIGAAAPSLQAAVFLTPITSIPMMLFAGFLIFIHNIPPALRWLQWLSYFHYSFEACTVAVFSGTPQAYVLGPEMLGFDDEHTSLYGFDIGMLILFFIIFKVLAYLVLRKQAKRTY